MATLQAVVDYLAAHPDVIVEQYANESALLPREIVDALPRAMRRFMDGARFVEIMTEVAGWAR